MLPPGLTPEQRWKRGGLLLPDLLNPSTYLLALAYRDAGRSEEARVLLKDLRPSVAGNGALEPQVEEALRSLP